MRKRKLKNDLQAATSTALCWIWRIGGVLTILIVLITVNPIMWMWAIGEIGMVRDGPMNQETREGE